jgi:hypothetical protein
MQIYIQRNGQEHGPYREEEARSYLQGGQLLANDLARLEAERGWRPLREVLAPTAAVVATQPQPNYAVVAQSYPAVTGSTQPVTIVDIRMSFGSMVGFMIKWALASIPALIIVWIILGAIIGLISLVFGGLLGSFRFH